MVKINGSKVTIELDLDNQAPLSKSGKTRLLASTGGFTRTEVMWEGKPISIAANVTVPANK